VASNEFDEPRLAAIYDIGDGPRDDLDVYELIVAELGASSALDIGCGTGDFACRLAARQLAVVGVDPAAAMLDIARSKPDADAVRWLHGVVTTLPSLQVDVATMTGNVAQVYVTDDDWDAALRSIARAVRPGGHLVFETRDPASRAWEGWTPGQTRTRLDTRLGAVEVWCETTSVDDALVSFRWTHVFESDGAAVTSDSTLRFRDRAEVTASLADAGFRVAEVRDAPDRPGMEFVFIAQNT
jgi:ubiquinone/menaquinone biosynthesis C-methylase UbiE